MENEIPQIDPDQFFTGAEKLENLNRIKDLFGRIERTVDAFHAVGQEANELLKDVRNLIQGKANDDGG